MKTCEEILEALPALAEEVLDGAEAAEIRAHLAGCPECAAAWKRHILIGRHFRETDLAVRHDYVWMRMRKLILDQSGFGTQRILKSAQPRRRALGLAIAGVAASLVVVGAYALIANSGSGSARTDLVKGQRKAPPAPPKIDPDAKPPSFEDRVVERTVEITPPKDEGPQDEEPKDRVVEKAPPPPTPDKKDVVVKTQDPKPEKDPVVNDPPKKEETVAKDPPKSPSKNPPVAPEPPTLASLLPGDPRYAVKLAHEQADILLPLESESKQPVLKRDSREQVRAVLRSARSRLLEMRDLALKNPKADVSEFVDAYAVLVGEGAGPIIFRLANANQSSEADRELREHSGLLEAMPEALKPALKPALAACDFARSHRGAILQPRTCRAPTSGAFLRARETVALLEAKPGISNRTFWAFELLKRRQGELLTHARGGRKAEAESAYEGYERLLTTAVLMLEWIDPKNSAQPLSFAKNEMRAQVDSFRRFAAPAELRDLINKGRDLASAQRQKINEIEAQLAKGPKTPEKPPEKKEPEPPPKDPPKEPPPPKPPFGETPPPSPPPPPQPPFGEDPPK
jgi:hypothetical protein